MDYDVVILGGGLVGCSLAYELCKYSLNIAVIEKNFDIAEDAALFNSSLILDGKDEEDEAVFRRIKESAEALGRLSAALGVFHEKVPSFTIYRDKDEAKRIYDRAVRRGIEGISLLSEDGPIKRNPLIKDDPSCIIYSENTGVIAPYDYATAMAEIAFDNGVSFRLEEEVTDIQRQARGGMKITTNKNKYTSKLVIKTTFGDRYTIKHEDAVMFPTEILENMLIEKDFKGEIRNIITRYKSNGEVVTILPSSTNKLVASFRTNERKEFSGVKKEVESVIGPFPAERVDILNQTIYWKEPVFLDCEFAEKGYIHVQAKSYAVDSIMTSLTKDTVSAVVEHFKAMPVSEFKSKTREYYRFSEMTDKERNELIRIDPKYGNMVCLCSNVTEGEIVDSIRRPLGARTVEGVRRRTRMVFGRCQGSHCLTKVIRILARELDKNPMDIMNDKKNSQVIASRIKEFDTM